MPELPRMTANFRLIGKKAAIESIKKGLYRMVIPHHSGEILHPKIIKQLFEIIEVAKD